MKVILLRNVPKVGKKYDVVDVADGYANNFLFGRRLAERATPARIAAIEQARVAHQAEEDARLEDLKEKLAALKERVITLPMKADEQGHLFKKVRAEDILSALKDEAEVDLPLEAILLESPLSQVGEYEVGLDVVGMDFVVKLEIVKE